MASPSKSGIDFKARRQPSLVDQVADALAKRIRSGAIGPGQMLPPTQALARDLSVSRTVVREALARLSVEGLIVSRQGLGVFVADALPPEKLAFPVSMTQGIGKILELRLGIETEAAALAAGRRAKSDIRRMRAMLDAMERFVDGEDIDRSIAADVDFHRAICEATRNDYFEKIFTFLSQFLHQNISVSRRNSAGIEGRGLQAQGEHRAVFAAIADGDADRARAEMRAHILNTAARLGLPVETASARRLRPSAR